MNKGIFLDRDGVINIDNGYTHLIQDFKFRRNIFDLCKHLKKLGYKIFIVTNQSGIGRKFFSVDNFILLTNWMLSVFDENGIEINDVSYCPHTPDDNCKCRKPGTKLITNILEKYKINPDLSWLIGDKFSDIEAGKNSGISNTILLESKYTNRESNVKPAHFVKSLNQIIEIIKV